VRPPALAAVLSARGYRPAGEPTAVETADLGAVAPEPSVELSEQVDDAWIELWAESRSFDRLDVARRLLAGSPGRTAFARVDDVAVGRGVAVGAWLGITSMLTVPAARRRGHGRSVLSALLAWGSEQGCSRVLLQVEASNAPARGLYAAFGFRPSHEYRYLAAP
jgi:GNAT superfamily N-acetyltransferase